MKDQLTRISKLLGSDCNVKDVFLHVVEELGEVAQSHKLLRKGKIEREQLKEETVDLVITALAAYCAVCGNDPGYFNRMFEEKCNKWEMNKKETTKSVGIEQHSDSYSMYHYDYYRDGKNDELVFSEFDIPK